jgi:7-cyano-7-deazaguanine synthase
MDRATLLSNWPPKRAESTLAILVSGGVDSCVLLGEALRVYPSVQPIYVQVGSAWEPVEQVYLERFLRSLKAPNLNPLKVLSQPISDVYGRHWSMTGEDVPDENSPDEAVFLPGRNVLLLAKALLWCHLQGIEEIATAPLAANPFPDATDLFYDGFARIVSEAVSGKVRVIRPYVHLHKRDVLHRGRAMPLQHTFSCIRPIRGMHCGRCNKCAERNHAFAEASMPDPTEYAEPMRPISI